MKQMFEFALKISLGWGRGGQTFSGRAALTVQELAEGQCLKSCNSCIQYNSLQ